MPAAGTGSLQLVFGASGYIGTHLVPRLLAAGKCVRASARNVAVLEARGWPDVACVSADALKPETLRAALQGVDVAYYLVHSMAAGRGFGALDREAARNFGAAAAAAGVRRIVYLGGLIPAHARSEHLRSRAETGDVLRASGVPVTELRAGMIIGPGSAAYEVIRDLVNHLPVMVTPRWVKSVSTPIALDDLLAYLVAVADIDAAAGKILDAGGPDTVTYAAIMRCYGDLVGRHPLIVPVPVLTPRLSSYWLRLVTTVPVGIAQALVEGLEHDFVAHDDELQRLVPRARLGLEDAIRAAIEADRQHAVIARWVEGSIACRNFRPEYAFYAKREGATAHGDVDAERVFATVCTIGGEDGWFYANSCGGSVAPRLAAGWTELPSRATAPDRAARRRRRRLVASDRARTGTAAHAADGNEGAWRGRARIRGAAAGHGRERLSHGLLASCRRLGARLLVRADSGARVHLPRPDAVDHPAREPLSRPAAPARQRRPCITLPPPRSPWGRRTGSSSKASRS